ncbi:MAG: GntR family transcriptional regulator [Betaproteobacteria bacterium]|nr:GntR family transcriptional regulator [Betaproteobacteria bacterium]
MNDTEQNAGEGAVAQKVLVGQRHTSLSALVADELRRAILTHRMQPGERLVEDKLSADLGVSRVPIREALRVLASEGLVEVQPRRGASVAAFTDEIVRDMVESRAMLEGVNAKLAARIRDPQILAELTVVLAKGRAAAERATLEELIGLNGQYHDLLAKAGRNRVLREIMRGLRERTALLFSGVRTVSRAREEWEEHAQILAAIVEGDEELAGLLATRHVRRAAEAALANLPQARELRRVE